SRLARILPSLMASLVDLLFRPKSKQVQHRILNHHHHSLGPQVQLASGLLEVSRLASTQDKTGQESTYNMRSGRLQELQRLCFAISLLSLPSLLRPLLRHGAGHQYLPPLPSLRWKI
ncbi:hypothetical protein BGX29_009267, partial [Mortierella sp. GBA35]